MSKEIMSFKLLEEPSKMSIAEAIELFGDPALNAHHEEGRHQRVHLVSATGKTYEVHLGLPNDPDVGAYGARKQFQPPLEPHVFVCDSFTLKENTDPNNLLVDAGGVRVLYMHGRWNGRVWVPSDSTLYEKGVTVPDLLESFESTTGWPIDVVWVCQLDEDGEIHELKTDTAHPYVYPAFGYANGAVTLERGKIEVSLYQDFEGARIEYQDWLAARLGSTALQ